MWSKLSHPDKETIVTQVVRYLVAAFQARFNQAGSLYLSHLIDTPDSFHVGPIVSHKFLDGPLAHSGQRVAEGIEKFRGPFSNTADWLSCSLQAEIFALRSECVDYFDANAALANMDAAVRLCSVYPGDNPVIPHIMSPHKPFSFMFNDLSLKHIMVRSWVLRSVSPSKRVSRLTRHVRSLASSTLGILRLPHCGHAPRCRFGCGLMRTQMYSVLMDPSPLKK